MATDTSTALVERPNGNGVALAPRPTPQPPATLSDGVKSVVLDTREYDLLWRMAEAYALSQFVPESLRGDAASCFVLLQLAAQLKMPALPMMQRCYLVHGKPGMETPLALSLFARETGKDIRWRFSDDRQACTAYVVDRETGSAVPGVEMLCTMDMARRAGWKSDLWKTAPELMLRYRSAMWLIRTYYPGVLFGISSVDELRDVGYESPERPSTIDGLLGCEAPKPTPQPAPTAPETAAEPPARVDYDALIARANARDELERLYLRAKGDAVVGPARLKRIAAACKARIEQITPPEDLPPLEAMQRRIAAATTADQLAEIGTAIDNDGVFTDDEIAVLADCLANRDAELHAKGVTG